MNRLKKLRENAGTKPKKIKNEPLLSISMSETWDAKLKCRLFHKPNPIGKKLVCGAQFDYDQVQEELKKMQRDLESILPEQ